MSPPGKSQRLRVERKDAASNPEHKKQKAATKDASPQKKRVPKSGGVTALSWQREIANNLKVSLMTHLMRNVKDLPVLSTMRIDSLQEIKGCVLTLRLRRQRQKTTTFAALFGGPECNEKALIDQSRLLTKEGVKAGLLVKALKKKKSLSASPFGAASWTVGSSWQMVSNEVSKVTIPLRSLYPAASDDTNIVIDPRVLLAT